MRGTVSFFASSTESVTVTGDKDSMFAYYSFPLRVGSDAIQYRIEGAMKRTEKRPQITRSAFSMPSLIAPPALGLSFCICGSRFP